MSMVRSRRAFVAAIVPAFCLGSAVLGTARAQSKAAQEGADFKLVEPPQPVETGTKIEVLEFFWYGCPHCAAYDPTLADWRKGLPADVQYRRVPVSFDSGRLPHAKIYYALEALGKVEELHPKVFKQIHVEKKRMLDVNEIADFMAANGINRDQWLQAYNSFAVNTRAARSNAIWNAYKVDGTPTVAVDGKFMTSPEMAGGRAKSISVLDSLIDRARRERAQGGSGRASTPAPAPAPAKK